MNEDDEEKELELPRRFVPQSELDYNLMTTDPEWGRQPKNDEFKKIFNKNRPRAEVAVDELQNVLKMYSRDQRLANLDRFDDLPKVRNFNRLAGDLLFSGMFQSSSVAIHNSANILETSQSKNGFLRRRMGTFTHEQFKTEVEPKKKGLFGGYKEDQTR